MRFVIAVVTLLTMLPAHAWTFRPDAIRGHMAFLASDLLEGRGTGTRGYQLAAQYVAAQFDAAGLEPGSGDSYLQPIQFRRTVPSGESELTLLPDSGAPIRFPFGEGFVTSGDPVSTDKRIDASRVVLVGYGVSAPELKHDDYAGIDVRGKVVAWFSGAPSRFPDTLRAHYSSNLVKVENAAQHGAAAAIILYTRSDAERTPWARVVRSYKSGAMHWLERDGRPHAVLPALSSTITLSTRAAEALVANSGRTFDQISGDLSRGPFRALELPVRASLRLMSAHETVGSPNVVGLLRGSDPKLRDEYVVYSSHLDHLGITEPVDGDSINNGAFDNASGIAALIEIANAFSSQAKSPRRSVIFVATTGEEKGLRGADYFANNPTVPIDAIVANINIDQILMLGSVRDLVAHGLETSDLGVMARKVAKDMSLEISPDPYPDEVIFVRSDQYPFVRRGIPALYVSLGYKPVTAGGRNSLEQQLEWLRTTYHTPKDDLSQQIDYTMGSMLARFNYLRGVEVANRTAAPAWTPGNFFGEKFGRSGVRP
jgi:hypothetical protein